MPRKKYEERITKGLSSLKADPEISDPLFDRKSSPRKVGEIFQMLADDVDDLQSMNHLRALFAESGFSPQNPFHCFYLMSELAKVHYTEGKRGRRIIRTREYRAKLRTMMKRLAAKYGDIGRLGLAKKFIEERSHDFKGVKTEGIDDDNFKTLKKARGVLSAMKSSKVKLIDPKNGGGRAKKTRSSPAE
jgi:hypothetical protein